MAARLIALVVLSGCLGATARTPTDVVEGFYARRIDSRMSGAPTPAELDRLAPYLTPELQGLLEEAAQLRDRDAAAAPDDKPAFADGDLFSSLFEGPTDFRVVRDEPQADDVHRIAVHFTHERDGDAASWEDTVVVVPQDDGYAIADVQYAGGWDFASHGTLTENLKREIERPRAACHALAPSAWIVAGHVAAGPSAMSEDEADAWNGDVLTIRRDRVTFRDDVCANPAFTTAEMARRDFSDQYRVAADALDLPSGDVCVTEVSCADDAPVPGSVLAHAPDALWMLWDGVWFRAIPQPE